MQNTLLDKGTPPPGIEPGTFSSEGRRATNFGRAIYNAYLVSNSCKILRLFSVRGSDCELCFGGGRTGVPLDSLDDGVAGSGSGNRSVGLPSGKCY